MSILEAESNNTIQLDISESSPRLEVEAGVETIVPGMLVEFWSPNKVKRHSVANGTVAKMFAVENVYMGGAIDDAYALGDKVMIRFCRPGDLVLGWIADGMDMSQGEFLASNGDGMLQQASPGVTTPGSVVGVSFKNLVAVGDTRFPFYVV